MGPTIGGPVEYETQRLSEVRTLAFQMPDRGGGPSGPRMRVGRPSRRARTLLMTLGVLAVLAMAFIMFAGFWTDWLWFRSVDYTVVFTTTLWTKIGLFAVFGLLMAGAVGLNIWLAYRLRPPLSAMSMEQQSLDRYRMSIAPYKRWLLLGIAALVGMIAGASAAGQWKTWLMYVNGVPFGTKDPQFKMDVSFYTFDLPWYRFLLGFGFAAVVLSVIAAAVVHYLYGGLRVTSPGARATDAATGHLSVLLGLFVAFKAVAYWLDRYGLAVKSSDFKAADNWTGLRYVDANAYLPAKTILVAIAAICAVLFFATLWRRAWQLPVIGFGLMVLSAILIGGLYPAIVQKFQVQPNEQAKESPYVQKNIKATRDAYGIAGSEVSDYPGVPQTDDKTKLRQAADTTASVRLLDPNIVSPAFQQLQQVKGYYAFPSTLAVDRYSGQDTVIGLRELNIGGIPKNNWINDHFKYTHGYGVVAAKGTTVKDGAPDFTQSDLPSRGMFGTDFEQRIYYGERTKQYSIVGGPQKELDYSDDKGEKETSYQGKSGVNLDNPVNRAAYALAFSEPQILYSGAIGEGSRILYNRTPKERVEAVAPWLTIDGAPYPAVVDGKVVWIVDAYTTTNGYPYASRTTLGDTTADSLTNSQRAVVAQENQVNYIRNSVKATVNAYDGTVNLYQWDTKDPVLKTWMKAFPGTVKPKSDISKALMDHLRYPQDLFKVQRELLTRYHVTDPQTFLSGSEAWAVPDDPTAKAGTALPPYYLSMKMPGQQEKDQVFSLTTTFTPNERPNLSAYMAVNADPGTPDYGKIRILKLPTSKPVDGPKQVQSKFQSEPKIAESIRLLRGGDSEVEYGNLLAVPLEGGMLYVEPVYVRSSTLKYPLLRKVLVTYGNQTAFEDTLDKALNVVFGAEAPTTPVPPQQPPGEGTVTPPTAQNPTVKAALDDATKAIDAAEKARQAGDWAAYGKAQDEIKAALQRAIEAEAKATAPKTGG
ncbi:integral membrane protein [Streptomyces sp. Mg1]|nr:integral membrane protein [Streptomyces sp. Mg1]